MKHADRLNSCIIYDRDFSFSYFAFKILERYLLKVNGVTVERPQHMLMRVAVCIHGDDIDSAIETYNYMSEKYFIHNSTTLFAAGRVQPELSSAFIVPMPEDSLEGIFKCVKNCAMIAKTGGKVGVNIHNIRAKGTDIIGTNGISNGLIPMLRVFNHAALSIIHPVWKTCTSNPFTIYLEPWHADIMEFLNLKKSTGKDEYRARDLSYALWVPDLFMSRVSDDKHWSLMCPHQTQKLQDCWGEEFEKLYEKYESENRYVKQIRARDLWQSIRNAQIETGSPHILFKDACNKKSNQSNLGTIKGSSTLSALVQYTSPNEIAVGNLGSIALNMFVKIESKTFDFEKLKKVANILTKNLNKIIDISCSSLPEARNSIMRHRPIGIGVQGLADTFAMLQMPFESEEASELNIRIFETIYYGALEASCELAETVGCYSSYEGSPVSKGILQYDMWDVKPTNLWNWDLLKQKISKYGVRNSLLVAIFATETDALIFDNRESIEPFLSVVDTKKVGSGEFQVINQHLIKDLSARNLWNDTIINEILANNGSVQNISSIPEDLKALYKTSREIKQKVIIDMASDRGAFVDQSQSLNLFLPSAKYNLMYSMLWYAWEKGLKTGIHMLK